MIEEYMNQTITWKKKASANDYNESTYTSKTIKVRYEYKRTMVRNFEGEEVVSNATVYTTSAIKPDDNVTFDSVDWQVLAVENCVGLEGGVNHYEVYV